MPLLYSRQTLDPTLAPRLLLLSLIVIVLLIFFYAGLSKKMPVRIPGVPFFLAYLFYLLTGLASLFVAINPSEGLFDLSRTFLMIVFLFLLIQIFGRHERVIPFIVGLVATSAIIASLIGISEYFRLVYGKPQAELYDALYNVKGLMGHKNQFAIFLFLTIPFVLFGTISLRKKLRILSGTALALVFLTIFLVQTRSVWIAVVLFMLLSLTLYLIGPGRVMKIEDHLKSWITLLAGVTLAALATGIYIHKDQDAAQVVQYKLKSIYNLDSESNRGRIEMGRATIAMIADKPLLGFGAGNWKINYPPYYARYQGVEYKKWRRPHNDFLWVFAEKGIFGLVSYVSLFVFLLAYCIRIILSDAVSMEKRLFSAFLFSAIIGYMVISNFSFPLERLASQVYLCLIMALVLHMYAETTSGIGASVGHKLIKGIVRAVFPLLLFIFYYGISLTRSDYYAFHLNNAYSSKDYKASILLSHKAFSPLHTLDQLSNPYHFHSGYGLFFEGMTIEAKDDLREADYYHPFNYMVLSNLAALEARMKEYDVAVVHYRKALAIYPFHMKSRYNLSMALYRQGDLDGALKELLKVKVENNDDSFTDLYNTLLARIDGSPQ
jgi:O-antigen ligase